MIKWPDLKFAPINLWTSPRLAAQLERESHLVTIRKLMEAR